MISKVQHKITYNQKYWSHGAFYGHRFFPMYRKRFLWFFWTSWIDLAPSDWETPRGLPTKKQAEYVIRTHKKSYDSKEKELNEK